MNTQNNEQKRLIDLLAATSQDGSSHEIRTHLENRFRDPKVCEAIIDYTHAFTRAQCRLENDINFGVTSFTSNQKQEPESQLGDGINFGSGTFTHSRKIAD